MGYVVIDSLQRVSVMDEKTRKWSEEKVKFYKVQDEKTGKVDPASFTTPEAAERAAARRELQRPSAQFDQIDFANLGLSRRQRRMKELESLLDVKVVEESNA